MLRQISIDRLVLCFLALCLLEGMQTFSRAAKGQEKPEPVRELFVPFEELDVLLGNETRRIYMSRAEYDALLEKAKIEPSQMPPEQRALIASDYRATIEEGRALLRGELQLDVLVEGIQAIPLPFSGVGIRAASLDDQPAALAKGDQGQVWLFVEGIGKHRLNVDLVLPIATDAAQQTLKFQVPIAPANSFQIIVPGNVEIISGAAVIAREVKQEADITEFLIVPSRDPMTVVMSLNNRKLRDQSTVVARGVVISEITQAYERLHATMAMTVLNGAADEFRFALDDDLEVASVRSDLLSRWSIDKVDGRQQLVVNLRTPAVDRDVIHIRLDRLKPSLDTWKAPIIEPLNVAGYSSVIGLMADDRLNVSNIESESLIAVDSKLLIAALPASLLVDEAGAPKLNAISAFFAADAKYAVNARFDVKKARIVVGSKSIVTLSDQGLTLDSALTLIPQNEKLFSFEFECPATWTIESVTAQEQAGLQFDRFPIVDPSRSDSSVRIRVTLPGGISPSSQQTVQIKAVQTPANWLSKWETQSVTLPNFPVTDAETQFGSIAIRAQDDLQVTPESTEGLLVMNAEEKAQLQWNQQSLAAAYRFENANWKALVKVSKLAPRAVAQVFSFIQVTNESLSAHTEIIYDVKQSRLQSVSFTLPEDTPSELSIRGLADTAVKETSSSVSEGRRLWIVQLAERKSGTVKIAVDFTRPLATNAPSEITLPIARADAVDYQSGAVAVEGHSELEIEIAKHPRAVDIGELVDAEYQVGKRLIGVFGYVGTEDDVSVKISRRPIHALPTTIVQRAELVTLVSAHGISQTAARYNLRTKAAYIESQLPPGATLWSVMLDGKPALPQRTDDRVLIALPPMPQSQTRDLQLVYECQSAKVTLRDTIQYFAPRLSERERQNGEPVAIPIADVKWNLVLPYDYEVSLINGNLSPISADRRSNFNQRLLQSAIALGGEKVAVLRQSRILSAEDRPDAATSQAPSVLYFDNELPPSSQANNDPFGEATLDEMAAKSNEARRAGAMGSEGKPSQPQAQLPQPSIQSLPTPSDGPAPSIVQAVPTETAPMSGYRSDDDAIPSSLGRVNRPQKQLWALEGLRSLSIHLENAPNQNVYSLQSLGHEPYAEVTLVHKARLDWLAIAVGTLVFLVGLLFVKSHLNARVRYFFIVGLIAFLVPPVSGYIVELEPISQAMITALAVLAITLVLTDLVQRIVRSFMRALTKASPDAVVPQSVVSSVTLFIALNVLTQASTYAQEPAVSTPPPGQIITSAEQLEQLFRSLENRERVSLPKDAIIVPFDPALPPPSKEAQKLLVPYENYVKLWNLANPEQRLESPALPSQFAWANAQYALTLDGDTSLLMTGSIYLDQFTESEIAIELPLFGCVVEQALLDGKSPRLQALNQPPEMVQQNAAQQQAVAGQPAPPVSKYMLYTRGKGRKQLELRLRWQLDKSSGWRAIQGSLPPSPASQLTITVPKEKTEVRLAGGLDRGNFETEGDQQQIQTSLGSDGLLSISWRDKITEATIDQGLSVQARSVFDIQEDAIKLAWYGQFEFRRGRRDSFTLQIPRDYIVEKVVGPNIRGWTLKPQDATQQLDIELLKETSDRETLIVFISKQGAIDSQEASQITVPQIVVPGAMLQQGHVAIRRSVLLDVRAESTTGLTRMEAVDETQWMSPHEIAGILPIKVYQAYRYTQVPFELQLSAAPVAPKLNVQSQSLMRISQLERSFESRLLFTALDRPVYRLQIALPAHWKLQTPEVPGSFQWSISPSGNRQLLQIYMADGQSGDFAVILRSEIEGQTENNSSIELPQISVIDAQRQAGSIVVQADPAYDVRLENLQGCEPALLDSVRSWLADNQRAAARAVVKFESDQFSGQVQVTARTPVINSFSVTNVKLTDRSIEETIFIEANIRSAGIREFVFTIPANLSNAKIRAPHVRQTIVEPIADTPDRVRVRLLLEDAIMGQLRIVVEHDRALSNAEQAAPLPSIETGTTDRRVITIENSGRDELVTGRIVGFESLDRTQLQQRIGADLLGGKSSLAYLAKEDANELALTFTTKSREIIESVGARIGLAQTLLVVDEAGTYRATQEYRVENRTEPFLEIELPRGARLWTVQVAGEPIKPATVAAAPAGSAAPNTTLERIRIPLIKTAEGDLDYPVVIKFGGQMATPKWLQRVEFPLIHTTNIKVELSQVRLRLPESIRWFRFDGTLGQVQNESDLQAGWLAFRTRQLTELSQLLGSKSNASDYTKFRARNNFSTLESTIRQNTAWFDQQGLRGEELAKQIDNNSAALQAAQQQAAQIDALQALSNTGNREVLRDLYTEQTNKRSFNALGELGQNFAVEEKVLAERDVTKAPVKNEWLGQNNLQNSPETKFNRLNPTEKANASKPQLDRALQLADPLPAAEGDGAYGIGGKQWDAKKDAQVESQAQRYGRRLQGQTFGESASNNPAGGMGGFGGGSTAPGQMPPGMGSNRSDLAFNAQQFAPPTSNAQVPRFTAPATPAVQAAQGGLTGGFMASLDVELPSYGKEYFFTTPRGEIELSAQGIATQATDRLYSVLTVLGIAALAWLLWMGLAKLLAKNLGTALVCGGLLLIAANLLLLGYLYVAAFALLVSVAILARRLLAHEAVPA